MTRESKIAEKVVRMCLGGQVFPMRKVKTIKVSLWKNIPIQHLEMSVIQTIKNDLERSGMGGFIFDVTAKVRTPGILKESGSGGKDSREYAVDVVVDIQVSPEFDEATEIRERISF